jgi:hypothetical protein
MDLARERSIPTERQPLVGEASANFCGPLGRNLDLIIAYKY